MNHPNTIWNLYLSLEYALSQSLNCLSAGVAFLINSLQNESRGFKTPIESILQCLIFLILAIPWDGVPLPLVVLVSIPWPLVTLSQARSFA